MCFALDLWIMNGVCNSDPQGRYTYISDTGNSVNDYFLVTHDLLHLFSDVASYMYLEGLS